MAITYRTIRAMALSFEQTEQAPHFDKESFRVKKKIFATVERKVKRLVVKLSPIDQSVFSTIKGIQPVPDKWGKQGWTIIEMDKVQSTIVKDVLTTAYCHIAPKKLSEKYSSKSLYP